MSILRRNPRGKKDAKEKDSENASPKHQRPASTDRVLREKTREKKKEEKLRKKELGRRSNRHAAKTVQGYIGYEQMIEDGVCWIEGNLWSKTFAFSDINYQIARRDKQVEIFAAYMEALNYCDTSTALQVSIVNRKVSEDDFKKRTFFPIAGDRFDELREDYNAVLAEKSLDSQHHISRDRYLTFTCEAPTYEKARQKLSRIEEDLMMSFKSMGCETTPIDGLERLRLLYSCIEPRTPLDFEYKQLLESNLCTKDFIAPSVLDFSSKNAYECDDWYGQTLIIANLPATMNDKFISELSDLPVDMNITLHIRPVEQSVALDLVKKKIGFMNQQKVEEQRRNFEAGLSSLDIFNFELKYTIDEAEELLDNLQNRNQSMFKVTILVNTFAETLDELQENVFQIKSIGNKNSCKIEELSYQQKEGFNSTLPIGRNHVERERSLTTASTAIFIPFTTQELYQEGGIYYGQNALSRNFIFLNRYNLKSLNGIYLGKPGSGKSFAAKREMISVLMRDPDAEVLIIDPEREYTNIALQFGGEVVNIAATSRVHINPFDLPRSDASVTDQIREKSEFLLSLCETVMGGKYGLTQSQKSVLDRCVRETYDAYFEPPPEERVMPTFKEFYEVLHRQPELQNTLIIDHEMRNLERGLEIFCNGSLDVFANRSNIDIENRLVVFDILDLGMQLRSMGMLIILDQIWNRIVSNRSRGVHTWVYIDEFQLLLTNEYSAHYFFELWTRSRKYGCVANGITQNVETLLLNDYARRMLSNSDFVMMFNQATSDRRELAELLQISDKQMSYVTNSDAGHGLLFAGNAILPFLDKFPSTSKLYKCMTTKLEEVHAYQQSQESKELDEKVLNNQQQMPSSRYELDAEDEPLWYPENTESDTPLRKAATDLFASMSPEGKEEPGAVSITYRFTSTDAPGDFQELMSEIDEVKDPDGYVVGEPYIAGQVPQSVDPNWRFIGWFTDEKEQTRWRNGTHLQGDLVLFGHWEKERFETDVQDATCAPRATETGQGSETPIAPEGDGQAPTRNETPDATPSDEGALMDRLTAKDIELLKSVIGKLG